MKKLDRSREFGEIYGSDDGSRFVQDDVLFDVSGNELVTGPAGEASAEAPKTRGRKVNALKEQLTRNLADA